MASFKSNILYVSAALAVIVVNCQADHDDSTPHNEGMHLFHGDIKPDFQKCLDQAGTTKDELIANRGNPPTPKELCLEKCIAESTGILKDGVMLTDVIKKNAAPRVDEATLSTAIKCLEAVGKISACDDMSKVLKCAPKPSAPPQ